MTLPGESSSVVLDIARPDLDSAGTHSPDVVNVSGRARRPRSCRLRRRLRIRRAGTAPRRPRGHGLDDVPLQRRKGQAVACPGVEDAEVIARQDLRVREDALGGLSQDHLIGAARVDVEGDGTVAVVDVLRVDDLTHHDAAVTHDLLGQGGELTGLRSVPEADGRADRPEVLRALVRARQHHDVTDVH